MIQIQQQQLMSLYENWLVTGIIVDSGESHTDIVYVYETWILYKNVFHSNFGEMDIIESIYHSLWVKYGRNYMAEIEIWKKKKKKKKMCFVWNIIKLHLVIIMI